MSFPMSYDDHYTLPLSHIRGSKTQNGRFPSKIAVRLKKVCYKVSLCENCQRQSCKSICWPIIPCENDCWGRPLLPGILGQTDRVGAKSPIFDLFSPVYSVSAVAPSEKLEKVQITLIGSTRFPMSPMRTSYIVPKKPPPPQGAKKQSVQNLTNKL